MQPRATALANGQYVVVWVDSVTPGQFTATNTANADIKARIFNADGSPAGAEFTVNTTLAGGQIFPNATVLSDGNFIVTWNNGGGSVLGGAGAPIATASGQEFTAAGVAVGGEFAIGNAGVEALLVGSAPLAGGGFVAGWQQGGASGNIVLQRYGSDNVAVGGQIVVANTNVAPISGTAIRTLADGNIVVAWNSPTSSGFLTNVQVFTPAGDPLTTPRPSGFNAPGGGNFASLVALTTGGFAVGNIEVSGAVTSLNIYAYLSDGTFVGQTTVAQQPTSLPGSAVRFPQGLSLSALANGGVAATWVDNNPTDGSGTSINLTNYGPSGDVIDTSVIVNTNTSGNQTAPNITTLSNGDLVVLWTDVSGTLGDASGTSIKQQLFDVSNVNRAPVAVADNLIGITAGDVVSVDELTGNDTDRDGDILAVTSIFNVTGGTVNFNVASQTFTFTSLSGVPLAFDYTISDISGATSTARAAILPSRTDNVTARGQTAIIDFLANDFLPARPDGYAYSAMVISGNAGTAAPTIFQSINGPILTFPSINVPNYLTLPVGQSIIVDILYTVRNPITQAIDYQEIIHLTLDGWAQIGGTGLDRLTGTALADHLSGGTGVANELVGRGGDDYYTTRAIGDTIVERANEGIDFVFVNGLSSFRLPSNVENLSTNTATGFVGIGNELNNNISGFSGNDTLVGGGGNDRLFGQGGSNELIGGTGDDIYVISNTGDTIVEVAGEGIDTVQTAVLAYALRANLENLTYTGASSFAGVGNSADNIITGGRTSANSLIGLGGNDTYVVLHAGHSTVETVGGGIDTVQTTLSNYTLQANIENLTYTGTTRINAKGNALDNIITGGANNDDYLFAGAGVDTLVGGAGRDAFFFDSAVNGIDIISDFVAGSDRIFLDDAIFARTATINVVNGTGPVTASDANSVLFYNNVTGALSFDADGNGAGTAIQFATLSTGLTLSLGDFVFY